MSLQNKNDHGDSPKDNNTVRYKYDIYDNRFKESASLPSCYKNQEIPYSLPSDIKPIVDETAIEPKPTLNEYIDSLNLEKLIKNEAKPGEETCGNRDGHWTIQKLAFLCKDEIGKTQMARQNTLFNHYTVLRQRGFELRDIGHVLLVLNHIIELFEADPMYKHHFENLLAIANKPFLMSTSVDFQLYWFDMVKFYDFMGFLLLRAPTEEIYDHVFNIVIHQLITPDSQRSLESVGLEYNRMCACDSSLISMTVKMLALSKPERFFKYIELCLVFISMAPSVSCAMILDNIFENVLSRFDPYCFAEKNYYILQGIGIRDIQDLKKILGESSKYIDGVMTLLLAVLVNSKGVIESIRSELRVPDKQSIRSFIWAFRYECRAYGHKHERYMMSVLAIGLLNTYGSQINYFSGDFMVDILSLAVCTEIPIHHGWMAEVNWSKTEIDASFKKCLILCGYLCLHYFPHNAIYVDLHKYVLGLVFLIDPNLFPTNNSWPKPLHNELRIFALHILTCVMPLAPVDLFVKCNVLSRVLWYFEWYIISPYDINILFCCCQLLHALRGKRNTVRRKVFLDSFFQTPGISILTDLLMMLSNQGGIIMEKVQNIICYLLKIFTSVSEFKSSVLLCNCNPFYAWPENVNLITKKLLNMVVTCIEHNYYLCNRLLISLFNFIWETVVWSDKQRQMFIADKGVYILLDIIEVSSMHVQCMGLGILIDLMTDGKAIPYVITWRGGPLKTITICELLARIFYNDCVRQGVKFDPETCVIENVEYPLQGEDENVDFCYQPDPVFNEKNRKLGSLTASHFAGNVLSKVYAILEMLTQDLDDRVKIADETYKLYKDVHLSKRDEVILKLAEHFLVCKLSEVWREVNIYLKDCYHDLLSRDRKKLDEINSIYRGWGKEIQRQQQYILQDFEKKERAKEKDLYEYLKSAKLTVALESMEMIKCMARTTDRHHLLQSVMHHALISHKKVKKLEDKIGQSIIQTTIPKAGFDTMFGDKVTFLSDNTVEKNNLKETKTPSSSFYNKCLDDEIYLRRLNKD